MDPVRPPTVAADATCVPPSITQPSTIASIEETNSHANHEAIKSWAHALKDWAANLQADHAAGKPIQHRPERPAWHRTEVTYADINGAVQTGRKADDGDYYAWVETIA